MKHARKDYGRMQDPANDPLIADATRVLILAQDGFISDDIPAVVTRLESRQAIGEGSTPIGEDEPVMLFRAKDKHFAAVLKFYAQLLWDDREARQDIFDAVADHRMLAEKWQRENGTQTPDLPATETTHE